MKINIKILIIFFALSFGCFFLKADEISDKAVLASYESVRAALVGDDLSTAQKSASDLSKKAREAKNDVMVKHAEKLAQSDSLDKAREHFKVISSEAIKLINGKKGYFVMTCSMAKADWIQITEKVENPYMGKKMLGCGWLKP